MATRTNTRKSRGVSEKTDSELRVYEDVTGLIASPDNPTPLVKLRGVNASKVFPIYLKLERYNPFGSIKDRIALEMMKALETDGKTVVEPSSGNTGLALAAVANARGIPIEIAVPNRIPEEKKVLLRLLGVNLREADDSLCPVFPTEGARGLVNALVNSPATRDKYVSPNQYENELNVQAHYRNTGPEIWKQTRGQVKFFFAGLGTCGTITGIGKYLKEQDPAIRIVGIEPASKDHKLPGMKRITGLAEEYIPKILDRSVIDDIIAVADDDAYRTAIDLARRDGIPVGPTTGAIVFAALHYALSHEGLAVAISPDDAFKYASFYKEYLDQHPNEIKEIYFDLCDLICPLSKIKASQFVDNLEEGQTGRLVLGDTDSLKSVVEELKTRGIKPTFTKEGDSRFVLVITK